MPPPPPLLPTPGQTLLTLVALTTSFGCYLADWNDTHIYHPLWLPHAKFHNGQTMSMGLLLGLATLWYVYVPAPSSLASLLDKKSDARDRQAIEDVKREGEMARLRTAVLLGALYWVTQGSAYFYPGVAAFDEVPGREGEGGDPLLQAKLEAGMFLLLGAGWWLEKRRILRG